MAVFEVERQVSAPREIVWRVISDLEGYAEVAPNLSRAHVVSGSGEGLVRRCYDQRGKGWSETCTVWDEGRRYSMKVDTSDYPYPLERMEGTWSVDDAPEGPIIRMRFDYELKYGLLGKVLDRLLVTRLFRKTCRELLDNWERRITEVACKHPESGPHRRRESATPDREFWE